MSPDGAEWLILLMCLGPVALVVLWALAESEGWIPWIP